MFNPEKILTRSITSVTLLVGCLLVSAVSRTPHQGAVRLQQPLDASGYYTFTGQRPPAMKDFDSITLIAAGRMNERISGAVTVKRRGHGQMDYKLHPTHMTGEELGFDTRSINGISYSFAGRITKRRLPESEGGYDEPHLAGMLTKFRRGLKVGEIRGEFKYEEFGD